MKTVSFNCFETTYITYSSTEYNRYNPDMYTYCLLARADIFDDYINETRDKIYMELDLYKKNEMNVAPESKQYTRFHLLNTF